MSKAVHWTIPFQSVKGINYEIRIYDDYTGSVPAAWPVTLQAGETPITTQEDASDDFFTPVRPSTGTISVIDPDGTLMEQLIPANNIARPVRLISIDRTTTPATETIEWQGFLSCEAYQQDYTAIAQELQLSINGMLQSMDSIEITQSVISSFNSIAKYLSLLLGNVNTRSGISNMITNIIYPQDGCEILDKYISTVAMFDVKENSTEKGLTYTVSGISTLEFIRKICTYMGWCAREVGTNIYLEQIGYSCDRYSETIAGLGTNNHTQTRTPVTDTEISLQSDVTYRGTNHSKSINQGARSVQVTANIGTYEVNLGLPEFTEVDKYKYEQMYASSQYMYLGGSEDVSVGTLYRMRYFTAEIVPYHSIGFTGDWQRNVRQLYVLDSPWNNLQMIAKLNSPYVKCTADSQHPNQYYEFFACAFLAKVAYEDSYRYAHDTTEGLYVSLFPGMLSGSQQTTFTIDLVQPIFEMTTPLSLALRDGYLVIEADMDYYRGAQKVTTVYGVSDKLLFSLQIGNLYWNGSAWTTTQSTFEIQLDANGKFIKNWTGTMHITERDGFIVPIPSGTTTMGEVKLSLWPMEGVWSAGGHFVAELFFKKLDVSFAPFEDVLENQRNANNYYKLLGLGFSDEVVVDTDLATDRNNRQAPNIVMDSQSVAMKSIPYETGNDIPERHLLNELQSYYARTRRTIELETEHPTSALPITTITGYDNRKYLPLAEERDWQQDTSKLTCYETPDGDS